jgi:hypothetical protein
MSHWGNTVNVSTHLKKEGSEGTFEIPLIWPKDEREDSLPQIIMVLSSDHPIALLEQGDNDNEVNLEALKSELAEGGVSIALGYYQLSKSAP